MSTYLFGALLALAGLLLGPVITKYAAKRTTKQPVSIDLEAEKDTLASVLQRPQNYVFVAQLEPDSFVQREHKRIWTLIQEANSETRVPDPDAKDEEFIQASKEISDNALEGIKASLLADEALIVEELLYRETGLDYKELLGRASIVYDYAADRGRFGGAAPMEAGGSGEPLLVRRYNRPSFKRNAFISSLLAVTGAIVPVMVSRTFTDNGAGWVLGGLALFALAAFSAVWALVDYDTMYLDMPSFYIGGGISWIFAIAASLSAHNPGRLLQGLYIVLGTAIVFEVGSFLYKKARGQYGMGGGDTYIVIATAGVPAAIAGSFIVGYYAVLASMVTAILGWLVLRIMRKVTSETPFAFGPYLALGWIVGFIFVITVGLGNLEFI